ncbi:MAG TPA: phosphoenolpyruvate synthase [Gemmatimonadales bacterium]|nr:phosphoenolpyruvate synthase [Gemmatimonadales bacterium]
MPPTLTSTRRPTDDATAPAAPATPAAPLPYVLRFDAIDLASLPLVGGKNASLGELLRNLTPLGVRVPDGFALTADAFRLHLQEAGLTPGIYEELERLDAHDLPALAATARAIRERIAAAPLPAAVRDALLAAYRELSGAAGAAGAAAIDVAVRSSATAEDLPTASFAGQQESYLNVRGEEALDRAVRDCFASLYTDRAIVYRRERGFRHADVALSVGVQRMVRSDLGSAGVIFTLDPETGFRDVVVVSAAWGLGETVVKGRVRPDEYLVHKPTLAAGYRPILRREVGTKAVKLVYAEGGSRPVREERVADADRRRLVLDDDAVLTLARWAMLIEQHYAARAGRPTPMDIEWARDGRTDELFVVQARPETVHADRAPRFETWHRRGTGPVLVTGQSVGTRVGQGGVRVVHSAAELPAFRPGEVLVAPMTDPDWEPVLKRAAAVVTDEGGRTCHAAIVSRELGIPCVVGTGAATRLLHDGQAVTVSCAEGERGLVYEGRVPFQRTELDPATLPLPRVPLMLNLANPDVAFALARLPAAGVGLMRLEFVISTWIGVHPMAALHPERLHDPAVAAAIHERAGRFATPAAFFVDRLATAIALMAAAFHPRPVIVRFSDFKTNEYAGLLGGEPFEPLEANPMIGFRGASRYYDDRYREAFGLECEAIARVRAMGLGNVKVMIPFCRTVAEARKVLAEMAAHGLERGRDGLEVYLMCEIPNNVVLADQFAPLVDGYSIGSNDLTQLALGVDRDSELLAHVFDERDPGVERLISLAVETAHFAGIPIGICGQAPSDYPEFAEFLADLGIDSISLNPDSLPAVATRLARRMQAPDGAPAPGRPDTRAPVFGT